MLLKVTRARNFSKFQCIVGKISFELFLKLCPVLFVSICLVVDSNLNFNVMRANFI